MWINDYGYKAGGWTVGRYPRHLADVNQDGKAYIVGFADISKPEPLVKDTSTPVFLSTGSGFTKPP